MIKAGLAAYSFSMFCITSLPKILKNLWFYPIYLQNVLQNAPNIHYEVASTFTTKTENITLQSALHFVVHVGLSVLSIKITPCNKMVAQVTATNAIS